MRRHSQIITTSVFLLPLAVVAADVQTPPRKSLEPVLVVASRIAQPVGEIAGSVGLIERGQIETRLIRDIRDLARYDATISVNEDASRFGTQGFAIRGLEGNRVAVELDGVPLGDGFAVGSFSRAGRNLVDRSCWNASNSCVVQPLVSTDRMRLPASSRCVRVIRPICSPKVLAIGSSVRG